MQFELIQSDVCQHLTMRAVTDFFYCDDLYKPGNIPVYVFLGILDTTTDDRIEYATRACFTFAQSQHMRTTQSFYVDPGVSIQGFIAFKTAVNAQCDVVEFAKAEHARMLKKIENVKRKLALDALINLGQ